MAISSTPPLLSLRDSAITLGDRFLFKGLDISILKGERAALVGRNGSGKSTLMKILAGSRDLDQGERFIQPGIRTAYLDQDPRAKPGQTLREYVAEGLGDGAADTPYLVDAALADFDLDGSRIPDSLSGGEMRRAALARAFIGEPDVLLLDEPTNHLDLPAILALEDRLKKFRGAALIISHDRSFLETATNRVFWLRSSGLSRLGESYAGFDAWSEALLQQERDDRRKMDKLIAEETRWSHEGISARRKRNQGRMRRLQTLRQERANWRQEPGDLKAEAASSGTSGKLVIEAIDISKGYDGNTLIDGFSTRIGRGDKIGIVGPNGAGKSTLINLLTGILEPDTGRVRLGTNLDVLHIDQKRSALDDTLSLRDVLTGGGSDRMTVRGESMHVTRYMKDFLFDPAQMNSPVSSLSGGERNRLLLAKELARPSNLIVLDEPTNDLDLDTLELLEDILAAYEGTLIIVSHDRRFLDRLVTSTIAFEGDGSVIEYAGGYSDYRRQRQAADDEEKVVVRADRRRAEVVSIDDGRTKKKTKLSYHQQRELDTLPVEIEALNAEIAELQARLTDPGLYARDAAAFERYSNKLQSTQQAIDDKEAAWLALEILKEELGGS